MCLFLQSKKVFVVGFKETTPLFQLSIRINSKQKILIHYVAKEENEGFKFIFIASTVK
jgi:hypothetical protein